MAPRRVPVESLCDPALDTMIEILDSILLAECGISSAAGELLGRCNRERNDRLHRKPTTTADTVRESSR